MVAALVWLGVTLTSVRAELLNFRAENHHTDLGILRHID